MSSGVVLANCSRCMFDSNREKKMWIMQVITKKEMWIVWINAVSSANNNHV